MYREYIVLQAPIEWVIDYEPPWLGPAVILIGLGLFITGYARKYSTWPLRLWVFSMFGGGFGILPWVMSYPTIFASCLTFLGSWFGGVATMRAFLKIVHYGRKAREGIRAWRHGEPSKTGKRDVVETLSRKVALRISFQAVTLLCILLSVWVVMLLATYGEVTLVTIGTNVILLWTLLTLITSLSGILWRFWSVRQSIPGFILFGLALIIAGAEIYNVQLIQTEIALFFISKGVYVTGYVGAAALWMAKRSRRDDPKSSSQYLFTDD